MSMQRSRGDPGKVDGAEGRPLKHPRLLGGNDPKSSEEACSVPGPGRVETHYTSLSDCAGSGPTVLEIEPVRIRQFNVNLRVIGAVDGGARRGFLEKALFCSSPEESDGRSPDVSCGRSGGPGPAKGGDEPAGGAG